MKAYDTIVVGSGISGLTMSLLLALSGVRVLLVEKAPRIGGSISRFRRKGIPFDVGFHFTGGMQPGGSIESMFRVLGVMELLEPYRFMGRYSMRFRFEEEGRSVDLPHGVPQVLETLAEHFPREIDKVADYFDALRRIVDRTPCMKPDEIALVPMDLPEDSVTLGRVLEDVTDDPLLRAVLAGPGTCYGVKPSEVSFANHARMCLSLYEGIGFVRDGGDAVVAAFKKRLIEAGVDIACDESVVALEDVEGKRVGRFVLSSGREVKAENCVFTIHPKEVLKVLPLKHFRKGFIDRVESFENSLGFFSVYGAISSRDSDALAGSTVISLFPHRRLDELFDPPDLSAPRAVAIKVGDEMKGAAGATRSIEFLEVAFREDTARWESSRTGSRPEEYYRYKDERVRAIMSRASAGFPEYADRIEVVDSASMLTYRDYLNSPDGAAYGIKQKIGQYNLIGQISLRNLFVCGQSSLMPGIMGAMISAFMVGNRLLGEERYNAFVSRFSGR